MAFPKLGGPAPSPPPGLVTYNKVFNERKVGEGEVMFKRGKCLFSTQTKDDIPWFRGRPLQGAEGASGKLIYFPRLDEEVAPRLNPYA